MFPCPKVIRAVATHIQNLNKQRTHEYMNTSHQRYDRTHHIDHCVAVESAYDPRDVSGVCDHAYFCMKKLSFSKTGQTEGGWYIPLARASPEEVAKCGGPCNNPTLRGSVPSPSMEGQ